MALMALEKRLQKQLLKRLNNSYKPKYSLDFFSFWSCVITPIKTAISPVGSISTLCDINVFYSQTDQGILLKIKTKAIR